MKLYGKLVYHGNNYRIANELKGKNLQWFLLPDKISEDGSEVLLDIDKLKSKGIENLSLERVDTDRYDLKPLTQKETLLHMVLNEISELFNRDWDKQSIIKDITKNLSSGEKREFEVIDGMNQIQYITIKKDIEKLVIYTDDLQVDLHKEVAKSSVKSVCGELSYNGTSYYIYHKSNKSEISWYLISKVTKSDIIRRLRREELQDLVLRDISQLQYVDLTDYITESVRFKNTGVMEIYGKANVLNGMLESINSAITYSFKTSEIFEDKTEMSVSSEKIRKFYATNDEITISYDKIFRRGFARLNLRYKDIYVNIDTNSVKVKVPNLQFKTDTSDRSEINKVMNAGTVTMADLELIVDLSWYRDAEGNKLKNYRSIETVDEFENYVMLPLVKRYQMDIKNGEECCTSLDTETTGLNIYYLSPDNPEKDHLVATPLSWEKDQGVVIFNDMEYFDNVPQEYMFKRLKPFLEAPKGDGTFEIEVLGETYKIDRKQINLIGHNVLFDGRVLFDCGVKPDWNNDTMQLAFNLNPKAAKGKYNNKLKGLTRRIFGHETPELSDVLGKGSEDKYRYIRNKEVAVLYGCADGDYTRQVFKYLRTLITDHHYRVYQAQDMEMLNELYISEYYGLRMDTAKVIDMANKTESDIEAIHEFLMNYIGQMIDIKNQETRITTKYKLGEMTDDEFKKAFSEIKINANARYEFTMKPASLRSVLFDILEYPKINFTDTGLAKVDKHVMKKLMSVKNDEPSKQMKKDLKSKDGERVIIEAKEFNSYKYPVAYVLSEYARINKEFISYFKPIRDQNLEGRLFKGYSLSRIETYRIMNPSQTMKGSLKALTLPFSDDYYMVDFDMAQVEYRIMVSIAKQMEMVDRLRDPEKDFHTESAATLKGIPAHTVPKDLRKKMKSIHFGIPYGLGDHSLCEAMYGKATELNMYETIKLKNGFCQRNDKVIAMLEHHRDEALVPREFSKEFKDFCGMFDDVVQPDGSTKRVYKPVGWVKNELGRYRLFDLADLDKRKIGIIRRAAGNFPIQAFAAELFRIILLNFRRRCKEEGIDDKIIWHMLIHDELLLSAHKDINPFYLYKIILEECMVTIEEHTEYFVGINLGANWKECKDDASEAPVLFVREMAERWDKGEFKDDKGSWKDCPKSYVDGYKAKFIAQRIHDVIKELQPNADTEPINYANIRNNMTNYTVRAYITDFYAPKNYKGKWKSLNDDSKLLLALCVFLQDWYGTDKMIQIPDGTLVNSSNFGIGEESGVDMSVKLGQLDDDNILEDEEDDFWLFDSDSFVASTLEFVDDEVYYDMNDKSFKGLNVVEEEPLKYVEDLRKQILLKIDRSILIPKLKQALQPFINRTDGIPLVFKTPIKTEMWLKIDHTKLREIDEVVGGII
ncbi:DNA polymerase [Paraclostridium bifermentans]|uniref:DNA polymerase n=1 Tax=Paraclostridium bifermentans TaxID=1490 RepID=UPI00374E369E